MRVILSHILSFGVTLVIAGLVVVGSAYAIETVRCRILRLQLWRLPKNILIVLLIMSVVTTVLSGKIGMRMSDWTGGEMWQSSSMELSEEEEGLLVPSLVIDGICINQSAGTVEIRATIFDYPALLSTVDVRVVSAEVLTSEIWNVVRVQHVCVREGNIYVVVPLESEMRFYKLQVGENLGLIGMVAPIHGYGVAESDVGHLAPGGDEDCDGLTNSDELQLGTDPLKPDTDGDGLLDGQEIFVTHTEPLIVDSDGDGIPDGDEVAMGSSPNLYSPVEPGDPAFHMEGLYAVSLWYDTPTTGNFSVYGISWPGGSATTSDLTFNVWGTNYDNAFTMGAWGASFLALKNGIYSFQIDADDEATIGIGANEVCASYPDATPSPEERWVLLRGTAYPVSVIASSIGGPAKLEFLKWGVYTPLENPLEIDSLWIGLDRTTWGRTQLDSTKVSCLIHKNPAIASCPIVWRYSGVCNRRTEMSTSLSLWTTSQERASSSYLGETVMAYAIDGIPASVRFTVVKLDVCIDGVPEGMEDGSGAFLAKGSCDTEVVFNCEPADLPDTEYITISIENGGCAQLLEVTSMGELVPAQTSYQANQLNSRRFVLRGDEPSAYSPNGVIEISHAASGARDQARFTVVEFDLATHDLDYRLYDEYVPDSNEETLGAFIHANFDDDDHSGTWPSGEEKYPGADFRQETIVGQEDDLVVLAGRLRPSVFMGGLSFKTSRVSLFKENGIGQSKELLCEAGAERLYNLVRSDGSAVFGDTFRLLVEGRSLGEGYIIGSLRTPYGKVISERIKYTCIAASCGDYPWSLPETDDDGIDSQTLRCRTTAQRFGLADCEWSVVGERSRNYNCLAWAVGRTDVWFEDMIRSGGELVNRIVDEWGVVRVSIDGTYGNGNGDFEMTDLDAFFRVEAGMIPTDNIEEAEILYYGGIHAAKKRHCGCGEGRWLMLESKCGEFEVIEHNLEQLTDVYGPIVRKYGPLSE